jgi:hypothetical protein
LPEPAQRAKRYLHLTRFCTRSNASAMSLSVFAKSSEQNDRVKAPAA